MVCNGGGFLEQILLPQLLSFGVRGMCCLIWQVMIVSIITKNPKQVKVSKPTHNKEISKAK